MERAVEGEGVKAIRRSARCWPSTVRSDEWPAWLSFWLSGCWRALAKGTAWAGSYCVILLTTERTVVGQGGATGAGDDGELNINPPTPCQ